MLLLLLLLLLTSAIDVESISPSFSWHTVPVFAETSNVSGVFDDEALHTLAKFPLFVAEKVSKAPTWHRWFKVACR